MERGGFCPGGFCPGGILSGGYCPETRLGRKGLSYDGLVSKEERERVPHLMRIEQTRLVTAESQHLPGCLLM